MSSNLPPLNALRAFVAAARHQSFRLAGSELNVSSGAISRHVKLLEHYLGVSLFDRQTNGVKLTKEGEVYFDLTQPLLIELGKVTQTFVNRRQDRELVISTLPIFAEKWLNPRLPRFQQLYPRVKLRLDVHDGIFEDPAIRADAAIVYTDGPMPETESRLLLAETLVPVCSPGLLDRFSNKPALEQILQAPRLEDTSWADDWNIWLKAIGQEAGASRADLSFALYNGVVQAAKSGLGIAIGHSAMISDELANSELYAFAEYAVPSPASYYLVTFRNNPRNRDLKAFEDWIVKEALL